MLYTISYRMPRLRDYTILAVIFSIFLAAEIDAGRVCWYHLTYDWAWLIWVYSLQKLATGCSLQPRYSAQNLRKKMAFVLSTRLPPLASVLKRPAANTCSRQAMRVGICFFRMRQCLAKVRLGMTQIGRAASFLQAQVHAIPNTIIRRKCSEPRSSYVSERVFFGFLIVRFFC